MRVLVATHEGQGEVPGDYCFTVDGELVTTVVAQCCSSQECGCGRGFSGMASDRATTTAIVVDLPALTREALRGAVVDSLTRGGWIGFSPEALAELEDDEEDWPTDDEVVDEHVAAIEAAGLGFEVGTVVGRRNQLVWDRSDPRLLTVLDALERHERN
jgi:hypothetical protein